MGTNPPFDKPPDNFPQSRVPPASDSLWKPKSGKVKQVTVVAILMIIHGSLVSMMGLMFLIAGPVFMSQGHRMRSCTGAPMSYGETTLQGVVSILIGGIVLVAGVLLIIAGIKNLKYRSRTFGIIALSIGALAMFTCYCAPTAIALLIYGLVIYINNDVKAAFALGEQGVHPDQIKSQV